MARQLLFQKRRNQDDRDTRQIVKFTRSEITQIGENTQVHWPVGQT